MIELSLMNYIVHIYQCPKFIWISLVNFFQTSHGSHGSVVALTKPSVVPRFPAYQWIGDHQDLPRIAGIRQALRIGHLKKRVADCRTTLHGIHTHTHTHAYIYMYIYIYIFRESTIIHKPEIRPFGDDFPY